MKAKDFVEIEETKFVLQLNDFWSGLIHHGASLGFTNAEIDDAEKDYLWVKYVLQRQNSVQSFALGYTEYKNELLTGSENPIIEPQLSMPSSPPTPVGADVKGRFRKRAAKTKASANYSAGIGELLHIVAPRSTFDVQKSIPEFRIKTKANHPVLRLKKKFYDGFEIWKDDGSGFKKLERVTKATFTDESALPPQGKGAAWKYKIIGIIKDQTVGGFSDVHTIAVYGVA